MELSALTLGWMAFSIDSSALVSSLRLFSFAMDMGYLIYYSIFANVRESVILLHYFVEFKFLVMKLFTKTLMALLVMVGCAQFYATAKMTVIDTNYTKRIPINYVWYDYNQDKKMDESETFTFTDASKSYVLIKYSDYGSAGNILTLTLTGGSDEATAVLTDVRFGFEQDENGAMTYLCFNKYNESLFAITSLADPGEKIIYIFNPYIFE